MQQRKTNRSEIEPTTARTDALSLVSASLSSLTLRDRVRPRKTLKPAYTCQEKPKATAKARPTYPPAAPVDKSKSKTTATPPHCGPPVRGPRQGGLPNGKQHLAQPEHNQDITNDPGTAGIRSSRATQSFPIDNGEGEPTRKARSGKGRSPFTGRATGRGQRPRTGGAQPLAPVRTHTARQGRNSWAQSAQGAKPL